MQRYCKMYSLRVRDTWHGREFVNWTMLRVEDISIVGERDVISYNAQSVRPSVN
jgi:hypothetical protein